MANFAPIIKKIMRSKWFKLVPFAILLIVIAFYSFYKPSVKDKVLLDSVLKSLSFGHFSETKYDDSFSKKAHYLYIDRLDPNKNFFIQPDIDKFNKYSTLIDDEALVGSFEFFDLVNDIYVKRIKEAKSIFQEILTKEFNFEIDETIELDGDKIPFAKNSEGLTENWRKAMKYQTMIFINEALKEQETARERKDTNFVYKSLEKIESESRGKILKRQEEWFARLLKLEQKDRLSLYLNCMVNTFDPHTGYYPPKDKENFDIAISGKLEGIGATLQEKDDYIKVVSIVPGSASWKQGQLKEGDLILRVGQADDEMVDIVGMRVDDAVKLIRGKKGTKVRLSVKKIDGSIIEIPIIRDVVIIEETYAKSAIIKDPGGKLNYGYINLPSFYVDFNDRFGRKCSDDIEKEIQKLKEENIKGLVFDLRNNGGGSLPDVVKIAGLFIEKGPIVQIKGRLGYPEVLSDNDPKIQYDGPLVILVNTFSASASEILAAAMQDYKRAVIIGTPSTFGKGTVQRFIDLDELITGVDNTVKPLGSVKLTTQKFYRVNGGATQLKGVVPDIILNDSYSLIEIGEKEMEYPLEWSQIAAVDFKPWSTTYDLSKIVKKSYARTSSDESFLSVNQNAERLKAQRDKTIQSLNLEKFKKEQKEIADAAKQIESQLDKPMKIEIKTPKMNLLSISSDSLKQVRNETWIKGLSKDILIKEAMNVLEDIRK